MSDKPKFVVKHHLETLSADELAQYLRDVSTYIGLDPDLNGLDTVWLDNETGVGRTLTVYARRGTAEILRNIYKVDIEELTHSMVKGSIVFTAAGRSATSGRRERAAGSKYVEGLTGRALDNAIMTASTRALRRVTMQFTTLGILDESEVVDIIGQPVNPAGGAQLAGSPVVIPPQPQVPANNTPGVESMTRVIESFPGSPVGDGKLGFGHDRLKTPPVYPEAPVSATVSSFATSLGEAPQDKLPVPPSQVEAAPAVTEPDKKADKKPRKKKNSVTLEVEPETVQSAAPAQPVIEAQLSAPNAQSNPPSVPPAAPAPPPPQPPAQPQADVPVASAAGLPSKEQMDLYRKAIGTYTQQLPATPGNGSVQRMRAFITRMTDGVAPQNMTVVQWEKLLVWFADFAQRNGVKGLLTYINDTLGDIPKA